MVVNGLVPAGHQQHEMTTPAERWARTVRIAQGAGGVGFIVARWLLSVCNVPAVCGALAGVSALLAVVYVVTYLGRATERLTSAVGRGATHLLALTCVLHLAAECPGPRIVKPLSGAHGVGLCPGPGHVGVGTRRGAGSRPVAVGTEPHRRGDPYRTGRSTSPVALGTHRRGASASGLGPGQGGSSSMALHGLPALQRESRDTGPGRSPSSLRFDRAGADQLHRDHGPRRSG